MQRSRSLSPLQHFRPDCLQGNVAVTLQVLLRDVMGLLITSFPMCEEDLGNVVLITENDLLFSLEERHTLQYRLRAGSVQHRGDQSAAYQYLQGAVRKKGTDLGGSIVIGKGKKVSN